MSEVKPSGIIMRWHGMMLKWIAGKSPAVVRGYYPYTWVDMDLSYWYELVRSVR